MHAEPDQARRIDAHDLLGQPVVVGLHAGELKLGIGVGEEVAHHARRAEEHLGVDAVDVLLREARLAAEVALVRRGERDARSSAPPRACGRRTRRCRSVRAERRARTAMPRRPRRRERRAAPCRGTSSPCTWSRCAAARGRASRRRSADSHGACGDSLRHGTIRTNDRSVQEGRRRISVRAAATRCRRGRRGSRAGRGTARAARPRARRPAAPRAARRAPDRARRPWPPRAGAAAEGSAPTVRSSRPTASSSSGRAAASAGGGSVQRTSCDHSLPNPSQPAHSAAPDWKSTGSDGDATELVLPGGEQRIAPGPRVEVEPQLGVVLEARDRPARHRAEAPAR